MTESAVLYVDYIGTYIIILGRYLYTDIRV